MAATLTPHQAVCPPRQPPTDPQTQQLTGVTGYLEANSEGGQRSQ